MVLLFTPTQAESDFVVGHLREAMQGFIHETGPDLDVPTSENRFVLLADAVYYEALRELWRLRTRPEVPLPETDRFWLYRLFDKTHRLLYVGITANPRARLRQHRQRYGDLLDHWSVDEYADREAVLAAEAAAIQDEAPAFNVQHPGS